jgi:hypoxanthine phosphoribosyltransferase
MAYSTPLPPDLATGGTPDVLELSWELFGELCRVLAMRVARDYEPDLVIGIAKAGVIPAAVIASILRIDLFTMKISRREGDQLVRTTPEVFTAAPPQAARRRVLIVDELTSSGQTLRLALAAVRDAGAAEVRTATCFARPGGYSPDFHALETNALLVFPWDRKVLEGDAFVPHPMYRGVIEG